MRESQMRKIIIIVVLVMAVAALLGLLAWPTKPSEGGITYVTTTHPLAAILRELTDGRARVKALLPPNASPHTYEFSVEDAKDVHNALAFFYVGENLDIYWANKLVQTDQKKNSVKVLDFLPREFRLKNTDIDEGEVREVAPEAPIENADTDPHFWSDPLAVKAMVPALVNTLCEIDPGGEKTYRDNGEKFIERLDDINRETAQMLAPVKGRPVFLMHPSFQYLCHRYGLVMEQTVEPSPGKEPTEEDIKSIIDAMARTGAKAIFSEPTLPRNYVNAIANSANIKEAHIKVYDLNPDGGVPEKGKALTYSEFMHYNADILAGALK